MSAKKKAAVPAAAPPRLVYCGPTIRHVCTRYTIFDAVPAALEEKVKVLPILQALIITIPEFRAARSQIESGQGRYYTLYREAQKSIIGGD